MTGKNSPQTQNQQAPNLHDKAPPELNILQAKISNILRGLRGWADLFAVVVAVISIFISLNLSRSRENRLLRSRLTEVLDRYTELQASVYELHREINSNPNFTLNYQGAVGTLQIQAYTLLAQAANIADRIPDQVTAVDYLTIANGFQLTTNLSLAESYYLKALEQSRSEFNRVVILRAFANALSTKGDVEGYRLRFDQALDAISRLNRSDLEQTTDRITTYVLWSQAEAVNDQNDEAEMQILKACELAMEIEGMQRRSESLRVIQQQWSATQTRGSATISVAPSPSVFESDLEIGSSICTRLTQQP